MWRRVRRRSFGPRRPVLFVEQYALALVTAVVVLASLALVAWAVFG